MSKYSIKNENENIKNTIHKLQEYYKSSVGSSSSLLDLLESARGLLIAANENISLWLKILKMKHCCIIGKKKKNT